MAGVGLCLGIDLGTTSVKVTLVDIATKKEVFSTQEPTNANVPSKIGELGSEQSPARILKCVCDCLMQITDKNRALIRCIGVSGQMHGVMLWNTETHIDLTSDVETSHLYTWQDQRASAAFLQDLPKPDSHQSLASGFGCVTLFWLAKYDPELFVRYNVAGSIVDFVITKLCGLDHPVMSDQMASSWGYFKTETRTWNTDILKEAGFPVHMLPVVVESGSRVGELCQMFYGIPAGTPVLVAHGDLQCSYKSSVREKTDAVMNISTSSQLCYPVLCPGFVPPRSECPCPVSHFPYFDGTYLAVAASLNGGNTLASFVNMLQEWFSVFGMEINEDTVWKKLVEISMLPTASEGLIAIPLLRGERHNPQVTGSLAGITTSNMKLAAVWQAVCEGVVNNLHQMMPASVLIQSGIKRLIVSGSVVNRHPYIMECVRKMYGLIEVVEGTGTDSAFGAGLLATEYIKSGCATDNS